MIAGSDRGGGLPPEAEPPEGEDEGDPETSAAPRRLGASTLTWSTRWLYGRRDRQVGAS